MGRDRIDIGELALYVIGMRHACVERDLGSDAHLAGRGLSLHTRAWDIEGVGNLCAMRMRSLGSIMRMETVVIAPTCVDAPLINLDYVWLVGSEMQMVELYDTQLEPWPDAPVREMEAILGRDDDLAGFEASEPHWYDELLYPCSYAKRARGKTARLADAAADYLVSYTDQLAQLPRCDEDRKAAKVRAFAERLFTEGGSAVSMMRSLFGDQTARRIVLSCMYGVKES